jgi:general secretion pathway protein M
LSTAATLGSQLAGWRAQARTRWKGLAPRERTAATVALVVLGLFLVWLLLIAPAWRTVREAPATLDRLDNQLQQMRRLAAEARSLKEINPVGPAQSAEALKSATERLGANARLGIVGDRATLTLNGVTGEQLRQWLIEARSGARARPVETQLTRTPAGYTGTLVLTLAGAS